MTDTTATLSLFDIVPLGANFNSVHEFGASAAEQAEIHQDHFPPSILDGTEANVLGELVFDKFAGVEAVDESLIKIEESSDMSSGEGSYSATAKVNEVEGFLDSSSDSSPLIGFAMGGSDDPNTWSVLFDDDIPVSLDEASETTPAVSTMSMAHSSSPFSETSSAEATPVIPKALVGNNIGLPTPVLESASLTELKKVSSPSSSLSATPVLDASRSSKKKGAVAKGEKYDRFGVIAYNRKQRSAALTPVIPDASDPVSLKRARNTEAARRSRARKLERMNQLEVKVEELLQKNSELENEVARLKSLLSAKV